MEKIQKIHLLTCAGAYPPIHLLSRLSISVYKGLVWDRVMFGGLGLSIKNSTELLFLVYFGGP